MWPAMPKYSACPGSQSQAKGWAVPEASIQWGAGSRAESQQPRTAMSLSTWLEEASLRFVPWAGTDGHSEGVQPGADNTGKAELPEHRCLCSSWATACKLPFMNAQW